MHPVLFVGLAPVAGLCGATRGRGGRGGSGRGRHGGARGWAAISSGALGGASSAMRAQCNYLGAWPY